LKRDAVQRGIEALDHMNAHPDGYTKEQYLAELEFTATSYDLYLCFREKAERLLAQLHRDANQIEWGLYTSLANDWGGRVNALGLSVDGLNVRMRPEQWQAQQDAWTNTHTAVSDTLDDFDFMVGALESSRNNLGFAFVFTAGMIIPGGQPFALAAGGVLLGGGLGSSFGTRINDAQSLPEAGAGALLDVACVLVVWSGVLLLRPWLPRAG